MLPNQLQALPLSAVSCKYNIDHAGRSVLIFLLITFLQTKTNKLIVDETARTKRGLAGQAM
jgi:DMSO/TMAO reductase YedYZ heme-binding membrane subunit